MRPIVLTILDGWGHSTVATGNAIANAKTPTLNDILQKYPSCLLQASGPAVGMTFGESGNSEVGHLTLGAGRVIFQYLTRINKAIATGQFDTNTALQEAAHHVKTNNSTLHIAGLLTSGAVHAHFDHLAALVDFAKANQLPYQLHLFTDGRDSGLKEASELFKRLEQRIGGLDSVATIIGRDLIMDRNNHWELIESAYNLLTKADNLKESGNPETNVQSRAGEADRKSQQTFDGVSEGVADGGKIYKTLEDSYDKNIFDAAIPGTVIHNHPIQANDAIVFFNFREDSMREIVEVFTDQNFDKFQRTVPDNLYIASMTQYLESPLLHAMFPPPVINHSLAEVLSENGRKHFHIAETEKYAHVTFFFNGLRNTPYDGETDFFIESLESPIQHPEMRATDIAAKVAAELDHGAYDLYVINIANGDILAHLGNLEAATKGVEAADAALAIIKDKVLEKDGIMILTADHGNVESMIYKTGEQETKHDENPVPFMLVAKEYERQRTTEELNTALGSPSGILSDVAPTILQLMQIEIPAEMTGTSLLAQLTGGQ